MSKKFKKVLKGILIGCTVVGAGIDVLIAPVVGPVKHIMGSFNTLKTVIKNRDTIVNDIEEAFNLNQESEQDSDEETVC